MGGENETVMVADPNQTTPETVLNPDPGTAPSLPKNLDFKNTLKVLGILLNGERSGLELRTKFNENKFLKFNGPGFYSLLSRLEDENLITFREEKSTVDGVELTSRIYSISDAGRAVFENENNESEEEPLLQNQTIRQHMSAGQIHLHVDESNLKTAIPVAEWYVVLRNIRSLNSFSYIDPENKTVAYFKPFIANGKFEVAIEIVPVQIGDRFQSMNTVAGKR